MTLLTIAPIMALGVEGKDNIFYCYSLHCILGVLSIQDQNVIAYASRKLKVHEKKLFHSWFGGSDGAVCS